MSDIPQQPTPQATEATEATEAAQASKVAEATEAIEAAEATQAAQATQGAEATEPVHATAAAQTTRAVEAEGEHAPAAEEAAEAAEASTPAPAVPELSPAQCSTKLAALFPALFGLQQPLPLKLRIQADIQARAPGLFTRKSLSPFLHRYTTGTPYLQALARLPQRHDLDGQPAGEVAAEHRDAAVVEVARRRALMDTRRAAEQAAHREAAAAARAARGEAPRSETVDPKRGTRRGPRRPAAATPGQAQHAVVAAAAQPSAEATPETPEQAAQRAARAAERAARRQAQEAERAPLRAAQPEAAADTRPRQAPDTDVQGRRERALLLRAYESSTLTRANFCVLKRMAEAGLEAQLVQARKEAAERPTVQDERRGPPPPRRDNTPQGERPRRPRPGP